MSTFYASAAPTAAPSRTSIQALRASVRGDVITPESDEYESRRRVWNGTIDHRPALIVRCDGTDDVAVAIRFARRLRLPLSVRGGGHNVAGSAVCDDGVVIDLSAMTDVVVDARRRRVTAQGGATIGMVDVATQPHGLAAPFGVVSATGIAGLTLGGGMGWMRRRHGLSCDALRSAEVVLANGRVVHTSADEHPELFWALRGGGGNFGVVTRFEFELHPVGPEVYFHAVFHPSSQAHEVLRATERLLAEGHEEFSPIGVLAHVPPFEGIDPAHHGKPCVLVVGAWIGDPADGERVLEPLRTMGTPIADVGGRRTWLEAQSFFDEDYPDLARYYWKSVGVDALDDEAIDRLVTLNHAAPSLHSTIDIWFQGGAISRVAEDATAFNDRRSPYLVNGEANWHEERDDEANVAWTRSCVEAMAPWSDGRMYLNFPGASGESRDAMRQTFGSNYERLVAVKRAFDADNVFRTHQSIDGGSR